MFRSFRSLAARRSHPNGDRHRSCTGSAVGTHAVAYENDQRDTGAIKDFYADVEVGGDLGEHDTCPVDSIRRAPVIGNALT